jgi:hypothetical protein
VRNGRVRKRDLAIIAADYFSDVRVAVPVRLSEEISRRNILRALEVFCEGGNSRCYATEYNDGGVSIK